MPSVTTGDAPIWAIFMSALFAAGCHGELATDGTDAGGMMDRLECEEVRASCESTRASCAESGTSGEDQSACSRRLRECDQQAERCIEPEPTDSGVPETTDQLDAASSDSSTVDTGALPVDADILDDAGPPDVPSPDGGRSDSGVCEDTTCGMSDEPGPDFPGAVTHSDAIPVSRVPSMPEYRQTIVDPDFNTPITRITGDPGTPIAGLPGETWSDKNRAAYQTHQAWNADGSMIYLEFGGLFINGDDYTVAHRTAPPGGLAYWSPVDPAYMFSVGDNEVYRFNAFTESSETWITFDDYSDLSAQVWNSPSIDGRVVAVQATRNSDGETVCVVIDLVNRTSIVDVSFDSVGLPGSESQRCRTAASGSYFLAPGRRQYLLLRP